MLGRSKCNQTRRTRHSSMTSLRPAGVSGREWTIFRQAVPALPSFGGWSLAKLSFKRFSRFTFQRRVPYLFSWRGETHLLSLFSQTGVLSEEGVAVFFGHRGLVPRREVRGKTWDYGDYLVLNWVRSKADSWPWGKSKSIYRLHRRRHSAEGSGV
jgi:hypothetical protein